MVCIKTEPVIKNHIKISFWWISGCCGSPHVRLKRIKSCAGWQKKTFCVFVVRLDWENRLANARHLPPDLWFVHIFEQLRAATAETKTADVWKKMLFLMFIFHIERSVHSDLYPVNATVCFKQGKDIRTTRTLLFHLFEGLINCFVQSNRIQYVSS